MASWLSKTDYVAGLQCPLALWLRKHARDEAAPPGPDQQLRFDDGNRVDAYAREVYPDGVMINEAGVRASADATVAALALGATRLYQATFVTPWGGCMVDVLDREHDGTWTVREVKMTTSAKDIHVRDAAFQTHVLQTAGLHVGRVLVAHIDEDVAAPSHRGFLREVDVTAAVEAVLPDVQDEIASLLAVVDGPEPVVRVGLHCDDPYPCAFKPRCWSDVPRASVFTIPGINGDRLDALLDAGIWSARDVPRSVRLPAAMRAYVRLHHDGPSVNVVRLRAWLASLLHPLRFLAVLTERSPLPRHDGVRPYEPVPILLSCHTLHADGRLDHVSHLHPDAEDPRTGIAEALAAAAGTHGHVLTYDADLVRSLIPALIGAAPGLSPALVRVRTRLRDVREIVEGTVRHPDLLGSFALEDVVRVLLGEAGSPATLPAPQSIYASYVGAHEADERHRLCGHLYAHGWTLSSSLVRLHLWTEAQAERGEDPDRDGWIPLDGP